MSKNTNNKPFQEQRKVITTYVQDGLDVAATNLALERARQQIQTNGDNSKKEEKK
ncbi:hypothetical protein NU090_003491 [Salmonella enterica]|uniref:hypothetical protein n=1 Tax=Klebsiella aerogenes TaxID=548 RepID=UPI0025510B8D|nr:hypothetical protein [Klebsiella aerogenes]EDX2434798.1 hypothetical protein [Salmonella enterica subsp. enterica serovar Koenigstuhl]EHP5099157.1 hypothetical protein [Salmonella enterica]EHP5101285.1 hypothetical protein [Salmonella enterica]EJP3136368.1 hypothetical protein [Salmonella enterica]ELH0891211.1 hypothetical protein [Salmonella enterica]